METFEGIERLAVVGCLLAMTALTIVGILLLLLGFLIGANS